MAPGQPCRFCAIVAGELRAHIVVDTDAAVGFLDHRPLFPGHVLVVPRRHLVTLVELTPLELGPFFAQVQRVAAALVGGFGAEGTLVAMNNVVSQSVAHLHAHVVPRRRRDGLKGFFWPRHPYTDEAHAAAVAQRVRASLADV